MKLFEKPLTSAMEKYYLQRLKLGDKEAYDILIRKNMRLVAHIVKKYTSSDLETEDMISIGTIGLIKAIKSFDMDKGSRLATYAAKCIDNELLMTLRSNKKRNREVSLNEPIGTDKEGNEISLMDFLESDTADVLHTVEVNSEITWLKDAIIKVLSDREREIIALRYGLYGTKEKTQLEISRILGISRSYFTVVLRKIIIRENY